MAIQILCEWLSAVFLFLNLTFVGIMNEASVIIICSISAFAAIVLGVIVYLILRIIKSEKQRQGAELKLQQLESNVNALQLENLESRLNPHLFKNILNSIQSHAYQTYFALDKLASVLDYILYESRNKLVTPKEEIEFALNLIEVNKIKISPLFELKVKTKIEEEEPIYEQRLLAPLISIDLIENAFKHADLQSADAFISIVFEVKANYFMLTVSNKISGKNSIKKQKGGIGSETLEQRLQIIYKNNFTLDKFVEGDVHIAHLKINLLEHKNQMLTVG